MCNRPSDHNQCLFQTNYVLMEKQYICEIFIYSMNYRYWFNPNIGHCNENPLVENKLNYKENLKFTKKNFMISTPIKTCCILMCA